MLVAPILKPARPRGSSSQIWRLGVRAWLNHSITFRPSTRSIPIIAPWAARLRLLVARRHTQGLEACPMHLDPLAVSRVRMLLGSTCIISRRDSNCWPSTAAATCDRVCTLGRMLLVRLRNRRLIRSIYFIRASTGPKSLSSASPSPTSARSTSGSSTTRSWGRSRGRLGAVAAKVVVGGASSGGRRWGWGRRGWGGIRRPSQPSPWAEQA